MSRSREGYTFPKSLRYERKAGVENKCEVCGKYTKRGEIHHIIGAYIASQNPVLTPHIIRSIENELYVCRSCHLKQNEHQHTFDPIDIGFQAWALFDLNPIEVAEAQRGTYKSKADHISSRKKGKKKRKHKHRRSKSRKSRRR